MQSVNGVLERFTSRIRSSQSSLAKSSLLTIIVMVGGKALAMGTGIVLARILDPDGYGVYSFSMAVVGLLAVFACLGMPQYLVRMVATYSANGQHSLLKGLLSRANIIVFLISSILAVIVSYLVQNSVILSSVHSSPLLWAMFLLPVLSLSSIRAGSLQGLGHVALGKLPEEILRPVFFICLLFLMQAITGKIDSATTVLQLQLPAFLSSFIFGAWFLTRKLQPESRSSRSQFLTKEWMKGAFPFVLLSGTTIVMQHTDTIMLGIWRSEEELGLYRVASNTATLTSFSLTIFGAVAAPNIAKFHALSEIKSIQKIIAGFSAISFLVALLVFLTFLGAGGWILEMLFGSSYLPARSALWILSFGYLVSCALGITGVALNMMGKATLTAKVFLVAACTNVILNWILIPQYGYVGASLASMVTTVIWKIILAYILYRDHKIGIFQFGRS